MLKFPPLVLASSALLCAWSHLGNLEAIEMHTPQLCALCGVAQHELLPCKTILFEYFNTTYPKAAKAAEMHRAAGVAAKEKAASEAEAKAKAASEAAAAAARYVEWWRRNTTTRSS